MNICWVNCLSFIHLGDLSFALAAVLGTISVSLTLKKKILDIIRETLGCGLDMVKCTNLTVH